jgi:hypothetical protein
VTLERPRRRPQALGAGVLHVLRGPAADHLGRVGVEVLSASVVDPIGLSGAAIGALAALLLWTPPLRRRIDALSDFIGGLWDRMLDAVLGRVRPTGVAHPRSR